MRSRPAAGIRSTTCSAMSTCLEKRSTILASGRMIPVSGVGTTEMLLRPASQDLRRHDRPDARAHLQPRHLHRGGCARDHGRARPGAHQHLLRRAPEPDDADGDASLHAPVQWFLKEGRELGARLHYMHYNFARPHQTLTKRYGTKTTPAMAAGVAEHVWSTYELAQLLDDRAQA